MYTDVQIKRQCRVCEKEYTKEQSSCKDICRGCYYTEWKQKNPKQQQIINKRSRDWYFNNLEENRKKHRQHYKENKETYLLSAKRRREDMQERMAGRPRPDTCEVCNQEGVISFDHDHKTGKFRGWLCRECNSILGFANDDYKLLKRLATFVYKRT